MSLRFDDIEAFLNVAELNSVTSAAERMSLSKSVISKRVSDLERRLGVRLLYRTTRNVEPTEAGHFFYKAAKASLQELNNAAEIVALRENDLCGELRIVTPMSFGTLWLSPIIADFMSQHPRLEIVLQMDDRLTDFEKEGYDLSIRVTRLDDSSLIARPLANSQRVVCCSPDYAERHGTLDTLEQLMQHECLGYNNATPSQVWTFEPAFPGAKPRAVSPRGRFSSNNGQAMRDAALRGQGLALLPLFIVAEDLKNGRLVDAAPSLRHSTT
ncbi:transcriptional regulator [Pseudomonas aeruginosa]|nr:transcriptional regulator [Pseudomonas aeruginosa]